jgi:hypothetical protein
MSRREHWAPTAVLILRRNVTRQQAVPAWQRGTVAGAKGPQNSHSPSTSERATTRNLADGSPRRSALLAHMDKAICKQVLDCCQGQRR